MPRLSDQELGELEAIADAKLASSSALKSPANSYGSVLGQVRSTHVRGLL